MKTMSLVLAAFALGAATYLAIPPPPEAAVEAPVVEAPVVEVVALSNTGAEARPAVARRPAVVATVAPATPAPRSGQLDPTRYGYDTLEEMELAVREELGVPEAYDVFLTASSRDGRPGIEILIHPAMPD